MALQRRDDEVFAAIPVADRSRDWPARNEGVSNTFPAALP
jgi:hypothetical protein